MHIISFSQTKDIVLVQNEYWLFRIEIVPYSFFRKEKEGWCLPMVCSAWIEVWIWLETNFLTSVVKLYYICDKTFWHIWKSFITVVKKLNVHYFYTFWSYRTYWMPFIFSIKSERQTARWRRATHCGLYGLMSGSALFRSYVSFPAM